MLIHKETFFQRGEDGIPSHWVVQYWDNDPTDFPEASYFGSAEGAEKFEKELVSYDDWLSSQEIPLSVQ